MLILDNISKKYRSGKWGARDVSLSLDRGIVGLLGRNGAGKTTLMQMLATVTRPTSGSITFDGIDVVRSPNRLRRRLGYLPQDFGVYESLTAREMVAYFAALKGVTRRSRIDEMLEQVNLHGVANRPVGTFSGGMRQRVGIAQALINEPDLLIVDEPTAGLDPEERLRFRNLLSSFAATRLVVLSTHIVSDVESVAERIAIMKEGHLVTIAPAGELIAAARGSVWQATLSVEAFDAYRTRMVVSTATVSAAGVALRIIGNHPIDQAQEVEPSLEDAFLYHLGRQAVA